MRRFVVAGTGLPEIISLVEDTLASTKDLEFSGFIDDNLENNQRNLYGHKFLGSFEVVRELGDVFVVNSIARSMEIRAVATRRLVSLGVKFMNLVHPSVATSGVSFGVGNVVLRGATVHRGVKVGDHNILLTNSILGHDTQIGSFNFFGNGSIINGNCFLGDCNYISPGAVLVNDIKLGSRCVVGSNCVVFEPLRSGHHIIPRPGLVFKPGNL